MPKVINAPSRKCTAIAMNISGDGNAVGEAAFRHEIEVPHRVERGRNQEGHANDALHDAHRRPNDDRCTDQRAGDRGRDARREQHGINVNAEEHQENRRLDDRRDRVTDVQGRWYEAVRNHLPELEPRRRRRK